MDIKTKLVARIDLLIGFALFITALILYISTLAPGLVFGDPSEYTFVPHIWGISHPPGYAFQTVLGGIWQRVIPIGTIAYRANLLSATVGAAVAALIYGSVRSFVLANDDWIIAYAPALLAGLSALTATDIWQHSIHANAHIVTALLATLSIFLLLKWRQSGLTDNFDDRWLFAFCVVAGLSVTHHPLLVFSFPAYTVFILTVNPNVIVQPTWKVVLYGPRALLDKEQRRMLLKKPELVINWQTPFKMVVFAMIGLSIWLYLPLRANFSRPILFGPDNTNTIDGFLDLVLARGLRVNLFHFGLIDQPQRWGVFWSLLRLQASLPVVFLMAVGLYRLWAKQWRVGLFFTVFLLTNLLFIINTIQDVMAYLMIPFTALMVLAGFGFSPVLEWVKFPKSSDQQLVRIFLSIIVLGLPLLRIVDLTPVISLRHYTAARDWIDEVYETFDGQGEGAILLAHWEHLTPLYYEAWVEDNPLDREDVRLVFVATTSDRPWVDNVWAYIDQGPIYVSGYQPDLISEGFRLHPAGQQLYRVQPPGTTDAPPLISTLNRQAGPMKLVGVDIPVTTVGPGQIIPLTIALVAEQPPTDIIFPYVTIGEEKPPSVEEGGELIDHRYLMYKFTTDSHWLSPYWQPGEVIAERFDLRLPIDMPPGDYPIRLSLRNLTGGGDLIPFEDGSDMIEIGAVTVPDVALDARLMPEEPLMADIAHRAGLISGIASGNGQRRTAVWQEPLVVNPGDDVRLRLRWIALYPPDENWKVFVHLVGPGNIVLTQQDNPPLGGSFPTFLWFPKWVPGQVFNDPYRLTIPADAPPGDYTLEIGMYGFFTLQRAPFFDDDGNLSGDRFILGTVRVENE